MATIKYDVEKFDQMSDFVLWKTKVKNVCIQQELDFAIHEVFPTKIKRKKIKES